MRFESFSGTPYEIGLQKGQRCKDKIVAWVQHMYEWWERDWGATDELLEPLYERLRSNSEEMYPEMLAEMDGIAEGAGLSPRQILLHNHYGYLWNTIGAQPQAQQCSAAGYVSSPQGPILGQNLDIGAGDFYFCELSHPTTGYAVLSDGWYGMCFGDMGLNERGLAVGTSALGCKTYMDDWETGIHNHFWTRLILRNCTNVSEAIAYLQDNGPMIAPGQGKNYLLVDAEGDIAVVERTQNTAAVTREHNGAMAATNFCLHPEMVKLIDDSTDDRTAGINNAKDRHRRILQLFEEAGRHGSLELMMKTLRWHEMPGALCRHEGSDPTGYTRLSLIALPHERRLYATDGPPCQVEYEVFELESDE